MRKTNRFQYLKKAILSSLLKFRLGVLKLFREYFLTELTTARTVLNSNNAKLTKMTKGSPKYGHCSIPSTDIPMIKDIRLSQHVSELEIRGYEEKLDKIERRIGELKYKLDGLT